MPTPTPRNHVYSSAEWKRQPTTADVVFGLELPYRAPSSRLGAFWWRWRLKVETTFALSMLQPWEKVLISEWLLSSFGLGVAWWMVVRRLRGCWRFYV